MKKNKLLMGCGVFVVICAVCLYMMLHHEYDVIKIGIMLPLTGENSTFGRPIYEGMKYAIKELNDDRFEFEIHDSQNKQTRAVNILHEYIDTKGIRFVVGDVSSSITVAMVPIAEKKNVFLFSPCAQTPLLTDISPLFARCYPSTAAESIDTAEFVIKHFKDKRLSVCYVNDDYGMLLAGDFKKEIERLGGSVKGYEAFDPQQVDFKGIVAKVISNNPDVIYLAGNPKSMGAFMRQFATSGYKCQIISDLAFLEHDCLDLAGDAAEGAIVPITYYNPEDKSMAGSYEFGQKFQKEFGQLPTIANAIGYDTIVLLVESIRKSTSKNPIDVASYIRNKKDYNGASGLLNFTNGDVRVPIVFKQVINGKAIDLK